MSADRPFGIPGLENPEVIGQGGFGTVYRVSEPEFGRKVAVKVISEQLDDDGVRRAFVRECQAMGSLSGHPHIVTVHRGGTTERGEPYIVMDLMAAGSLADRLGRDGPLPWAEVLEIAVTVAGALETAHRAGILHLDLKPANLLVSRFGEPKLGDFGISRLAGLTETTDVRIRASVAYAAPERLLEGTASVASDLYGLGATLFALLTGRPAFTADTAEDLMTTVARVVRDPVPDLRPRGVPDPLATAVERLMAKSATERFASASDAAVAMQAAQRALERTVTRAVIEGEAPRHGDTVMWPAHPGGPPRPLVPEFAAAGPTLPVRGGAWEPGTAWVPKPVGAPPGVPPAERSDRRPLLIAAAAGAAVVVLGAVVIALLNGLSTTGGSPASGIDGADGPRTGDARTSGPQASGPQTGGTQTGGTPTGGTQAGGAPPGPTTTSIPGDRPAIDVAAGVDHPETSNAATVLGGYFTAINERRYTDAFAVFSPDSRVADTGVEEFERAQVSSSIESQRITAVRDAGPDVMEVDVTFRSTQAPEFGVDGQVCTDWELRYELVGSGAARLIRRAPLINPPQAC